MKTAKMPVQSFNPDPASLGPMALHGQAESPETFTLIQVEVSSSDKTSGRIGADTATVSAPSDKVQALVDSLNQSGKQTLVVLDFELKNDKMIVKKMHVEQSSRDACVPAPPREEPMSRAQVL